ncbi:DUF1190 domain-containing protein [Oceanospirillum sediminis]|uniref:DUF1190 domain-containing protein n=1 Tax=Oceanospirillum sediminis TaxID=2760088 RepID=A0A839IQR4_9GAMM|nr:DUF1190 domain-containing protein [Oceanospirillum sediminis]MBB1487833.1 DUF1190 domain-containing protein [Oceanospirillum sediminis]
MKRSRNIDLKRMRKQSVTFRQLNSWLVITGSGLLLSACGDDPLEAKIYQSLEQCNRENAGQESFCAAAYQKALSFTAKFAPKYQSYADCSEEFQHCIPAPEENGEERFMPSMQAFALAMDDDDDCYEEGYLSDDYCHYSSPLYISHGRNKKGYYNAKGHRYGSIGKTSYSVNVYKDNFKAPTSTRTLSRGGFGSRVSSFRSSSGS